MAPQGWGGAGAPPAGTSNTGGAAGDQRVPSSGTQVPRARVCFQLSPNQSAATTHWGTDGRLKLGKRMGSRELRNILLFLERKLPRRDDAAELFSRSILQNQRVSKANTTSKPW